MPEAVELMLRTVALAVCGKIPEELNISADISKRIRLVVPKSTGKRVGAVMKIHSDLAFNPNPKSLSYTVSILNSNADITLR